MLALTLFIVSQQSLALFYIEERRSATRANYIYTPGHNDLLLYSYMEKVLSRVCHDSWCKSENKMSSKINQAELAFVLILGVCPRLEPKARVGNHAAREGKATTQKIVIATQATTMR